MSNDSSSAAAKAPAAIFLKALYPWSIPAAAILVLISFLFLPVLAQVQISFYPTLLGWDAARAEDWVLNSPTANFLFVLLTEVLTLATLFWFITRRRVAFLQVVGLGRPRWRDVWQAALGLLVYFGLFILVIMLVEQLFPINTNQEQALGFTRGIGGAGLVMAFLSLVVLPPIAEEIIFRGFFYGTLRANKLGKWVAIIVTSTVFGALHLFGAAEGGLLWIAFVDTFVLSVVLCYLREQNGTIWAAIGVHALKNGFVFLNLFIINGH